MLIRSQLLLAFCLIFCLSSCGDDKGGTTNGGKSGSKVLDFHYSTADIVAPPAQAGPSSRLPVDIYLDATLSMKGFSRPQTTNFSSLLDGIEAAVQNAAKSSDLRFFKYGRSVARIERATFVAARHSQELWEDKGFRSETDFAQAVDSTDPGRVSIFITDLFYSNADANKVVSAIQERCFKKGIEMGIMGLKSDYDGYVADVQPPVKVVGDRPLYLLVFGSKANISLIFSAFKNQPYVQADQALLLTRYPVKSFTVSAAKAKDSKAINVSSARSKFADLGNVFAFSWKPEKGDHATVDYTIGYVLEPYALPINAASIKAHIFRKDQAAKDSVADDQSLSLVPTNVGAGKIEGKAQTTLKLPEESFSAYQVTWQYDNLGKVELPTWITANSTQDFRKGSDENKTLGLDNFVRSLAVSSATQLEPKYGRMYLVFIRK
jgi:hypothetical protein